MGWIDRLWNKIFKNDKNYRLDYVINNIGSITLKHLSSITGITVCTRKRELDLLSLYDNIKNICELLDETTDHIPSEITIYNSRRKGYTLLDFVSVNKGNIPKDYIELLKNLFNAYSRLLKISRDYKIDDIDVYEYNSNIINIYIIIMDDLVHSVFKELNPNNT